MGIFKALGRREADRAEYFTSNVEKNYLCGVFKSKTLPLVEQPLTNWQEKTFQEFLSKRQQKSCVLFCVCSVSDLCFLKGNCKIQAWRAYSYCLSFAAVFSADLHDFFFREDCVFGSDWQLVWPRQSLQVVVWPLRYSSSFDLVPSELAPWLPPLISSRDGLWQKREPDSWQGGGGGRRRMSKKYRVLFPLKLAANYCTTCFVFLKKQAHFCLLGFNSSAFASYFTAQ